MNATRLDLNHARSLSHKGDHSRALEQYARVLTATQETALVLEAADCALKVDTEMALRLSKQALSQDPGNAIAIHLGAEALARQGQHTKAHELFRRAVATDGALADIARPRRRRGRQPWIGRFQPVPCPSCGTQSHRPVWVGNATRYRSSHGIVDPIKLWVRCDRCELVRVLEPPSEEAIVQYEQAEEQAKLTARLLPPKQKTRSTQLLAHDRIIERIRAEGYGTAWIDRNAHEDWPHPRLLEIGCGWGGFLEAAQWRGFEVVGVESSQKAASATRDRLGVDIIHGRAPECLPGEAFDVIVMWELIEHLHDPYPLLEGLVEHLEPGGLLALSTPSLDHPSRRSLGYDDPSWAEPGHLLYFDRETLAQALTQVGLQPMGSWYNEQNDGSIIVIARKVEIT